MLPAVIAALLMAISFTSCSEEDDSAFESAVAAAKERNKETPATPSTPTPPPPPATFTVTFDLNGGTSSDTLEYTVNNGALLSTVCSYLPIATKEDYYFAEWRTNPDGTGASISSTSQYIYSNVKYYAVWKKLVKTISTETTDMSLKIGEQKSFTVTYSPADAAGQWTARNNSSSSIADFRVNDKGNGVVEFTFMGNYVGSGIYSVADSKSNKAYAINVTVTPPDTSSIPELSIGTAASVNASDYNGINETIDNNKTALIYAVNLEANKTYKFQFVAQNNQSVIGAADLGNCYFRLYNSSFNGVYHTSYSGEVWQWRVQTYDAGKYYIVITRYMNDNTETTKGGVYVYTPPALTSITLSKRDMNLTMGGTGEYIDVTYTPADADLGNVSINTNPYSIVDLYTNSLLKNRITVYPNQVGTTIITVKDNTTGISATCNVTVTGTNVTSLALSQNTLSISQGEVKTLTVSPTPENATVRYYEYSYDNRIAKFSRSGSTITVTGGVVPGTITYTIYDDYTGKSASCTITNTTGITAAAVTDELPVVGNAASTSLADYTIASLNNAQPVKYYKFVVPAANSGKRYNFQTAVNGHNPIIGNTFVAGNCYFYLYDENFVLKSNTNWWYGDRSYNLTAGTYYFAIVYGSPYTTSNYSAKGGVHLYVTN